MTVTGLTNGASATTTVLASRSGYTAFAGPITGSALLTGTTPALSTTTSTDTGYTFTITNYDPAYTYTVTGATATVDGAGLVTVTGLTNGAGDHRHCHRDPHRVHHRCRRQTTGSALLTGIDAGPVDDDLDRHRLHVQHHQLRPGVHLHRDRRDRDDRSQRRRHGHRADQRRRQHRHRHHDPHRAHDPVVLGDRSARC